MVWAIGGLALAVALSLTAFAVAGGRISEPAGSVHVAPSASDGNREAGGTPSPKPSTQSPKPTATPHPTTSTASPIGSNAQPTPSDDHGGASPEESGDSHPDGDD